MKQSCYSTLKTEDVPPKRRVIFKLQGQFYLEVMKRLREAERGVEKQDLDAAPWQCTCSHVAPHPWICGEARGDCRPPTALPSRFHPWGLFLFPKLKSTLKGRRFQTIEEPEENSLRDLCAIPQIAFQNWKKRWKRCIDSGGEYCEGDKSY
jgi:hypothetical protein